MYAIVEIGGHQYKVEKSQEIFVNKLEGKEGDKIKLDNVLLLDDNGSVKVGEPTVSGAQISAKIVEQLKADKVIVFKKKRRKGYKTKNGHRQQVTKLLIEGIVAKGGKVAEKPKEEVKKTAAPAKKAATKGGDDLKKIEGVGPKLASVLAEAGIDTFEKMSKSTPEKISEILLAASERYKIHNPGTWPAQAKLAAEGKWDELKKWQDELDGGK